MLENRINRVTIRNFRSIEDITVDMEDLTVLVGPNGSGKSNFVDALHFVSSALRIGLEGALSQHRSIWRVLANISPIRVDIWVELTLNGLDCKYELTLSKNERNEYTLRREYASVGQYVFEIHESEVKLWPSVLGDLQKIASIGMVASMKNPVLPLVSGSPQFAPLHTFLSQMRFYSIFPNELRRPGNSGIPYPLDEEGKNLGAVLHRFEKKEQTRWQEDFNQVLALAVPGIDEEGPLRVDQIGQLFLVQVNHKDTRRFLNLELESDGTLRILGILTAIYQSPSLPLMGFEEPELLIHPGAMGVLRDVISESSIRSQIILTTHSPELMSLFSVESLRIVELVDGATKIGPISEEQRQIINDRLFSSGDLLRIEGLRRNE